MQDRWNDPQLMDRAWKDMELLLDREMPRRRAWWWPTRVGLLGLILFIGWWILPEGPTPSIGAFPLPLTGLPESISPGAFQEAKQTSQEPLAVTSGEAYNERSSLTTPERFVAPIRRQTGEEAIALLPRKAATLLVNQEVNRWDTEKKIISWLSRAPVEVVGPPRSSEGFLSVAKRSDKVGWGLRLYAAPPMGQLQTTVGIESYLSWQMTDRWALQAGLAYRPEWLALHPIVSDDFQQDMPQAGESEDQTTPAQLNLRTQGLELPVLVQYRLHTRWRMEVGWRLRHTWDARLRSVVNEAFMSPGPIFTPAAADPLVRLSAEGGALATTDYQAWTYHLQAGVLYWLNSSTGFTLHYQQSLQEQFNTQRYTFRNRTVLIGMEWRF